MTAVVCVQFCTSDWVPFRIQPNLDTRQKQLEAWCDFVLAYHRHLRLYTLDLGEAQNSALFSNSKLNRTCCYIDYLIVGLLIYGVVTFVVLIFGFVVVGD